MKRKPAPARKPRADSARNRQSLIDAAKAGFAEIGLNVSLEEIARRAEVGIGNLYLLGLRLSTNYLFKIPLLAFAMTFFIITTVTNNMNKSNGVVKLGHMVNYCPAIFILGPNLELVVQLGKLLDIETYLHVK